MKARGCVAQGYEEKITRIELQDLGGVRNLRGKIGIVGTGQRVCRSLAFAIKGNESKIHGLVANRLAAVFVIRLPRRFLRGKAVDGHRRAPSSRKAIIRPSGRIELQ